jgi:hypothetical protein
MNVSNFLIHKPIRVLFSNKIQREYIMPPNTPLPKKENMLEEPKETLPGSCLGSHLPDYFPDFHVKTNSSVTLATFRHAVYEVTFLSLKKIQNFRS